MSDALLDELQGNDLGKAGGKGSVKAIDPQTRENSEAALEATPVVKTPSPVSKMDAQHSTRAGGQGYKVTVKGDYYSVGKDGVSKGPVKPYVVDVNLPKLDAAMSVIKNKLLLPSLRKKYTDIRTFRTHRIVDVKPLTPKTPPSTNLRYAPREVLEDFAKVNRVPIVITDYKDTDVLRETLIDFAQNPDGFEAREKKRRADRAENEELAKLNPGIEADEFAPSQGGDAMASPSPSPAPQS